MTDVQGVVLVFGLAVGWLLGDVWRLYSRVRQLEQDVLNVIKTIDNVLKAMEER